MVVDEVVICNGGCRRARIKMKESWMAPPAYWSRTSSPAPAGVRGSHPQRAERSRAAPDDRLRTDH